MKKFLFLGLMAMALIGCQGRLPTGPEPPILPLEIRAFTVAPAEILRGASAILSWETINAQSVFIDQGIGKVALSGSYTVRPDEMTTYTLTARGVKGRASRIVTVLVMQPD